MAKSPGMSETVYKGDTIRNWIVRYSFFFLGLMVLGLGIAMSIKVKHLGLHPWDVVNVALFQRFGLSIGTWSILVSIVLIIAARMIKGKHVNIGTFLNALVMGPILDFYLWLDFLPDPTNSAIDYLFLLVGIVTMGIGGGLNVAGGIGAGPRDGFMLTVSERTGFSVRNARIVTESVVLLIGFLLGGPAFVVSFLYTFIQSPVFQLSLKFFSGVRRELAPPASKVFEVCKDRAGAESVGTCTQ